MAKCAYCRKDSNQKNRLGMPITFCNRACERAWHLDNPGNTFTAYDSDTPNIVEARKELMRAYNVRHSLACAGDKEARQYLRQVLRLRAIWDPIKRREVRLDVIVGD